VHKVFALMRVSALTAVSYRVGMTISLLALAATVVPLYFVANALQPLMAESIQTQGGQYFAFILVGMVTFTFLAPAMNAIPAAIGGGIRSGTLEALTSTPTRLPTLLAGLIGYDFTWIAVRALIMLGIGTALGAEFLWGRLVVGVGILVMIVLAYIPIGLIGAALVLAFRTSGPVAQAMLALSVLLGGVYYPTHVIPSWIEKVSFAIPLTYGLRALRQTTLEGMSIADVLPDLAVLAGFIVVLMTGSLALFLHAYRFARRAGTLSQY
jgi:ABC-2 type transport system permease protein